MGDKSAIEWTEATWNPTYGCTKISPACANCYIERTPPYRMQGLRFERGRIPVRLMSERLEQPLRWKKPRRIFVDSLSDLFHEDVPDDFIDRVFAVMALTPQHTYQVLTKRPERMREYVSKAGRKGRVDANAGVEAHHASIPWQPWGFAWPLPNVWLGVTVENQRWADERIPVLIDTPAAVRFISAEPLLGPLDLRDHLDRFPGLDWVIIGGESGHRHRPFNPDWARDLIDQCSLVGTAPFVKQLGGMRPGNRLEDLPEDLRVREYPR